MSWVTSPCRCDQVAVLTPLLVTLIYGWSVSYVAVYHPLEGQAGARGSKRRLQSRRTFSAPGEELRPTPTRYAHIHVVSQALLA